MFVPGQLNDNLIEISIESESTRLAGTTCPCNWHLRFYSKTCLLITGGEIVSKYVNKLTQVFTHKLLLNFNEF